MDAGKWAAELGLQAWARAVNLLKKTKGLRPERCMLALKHWQQARDWGWPRSAPLSSSHTALEEKESPCSASMSDLRNGDKSSAAVAFETAWCCAHCSLDCNPATSSKCLSCGRRVPRWRSHVCTARNSIASRRCGVCLTLKLISEGSASKGSASEGSGKGTVAAGEY